MIYVVDASVAIKWVVNETGTPEAEKLLDHELIAPDLFIAECANVLWKKTLRHELTPAIAEAAALTIQATGVELIPTGKMFVQILALAHQLGHPAYDCVYLAVAMAQGCPLVTADAKFVKRCLESDAPNLSKYIRLLGEH